MLRMRLPGICYLLLYGYVPEAGRDYVTAVRTSTVTPVDTTACDLKPSRSTLHRHKAIPSGSTFAQHVTPTASERDITFDPSNSRSAAVKVTRSLGALACRRSTAHQRRPGHPTAIPRAPRADSPHNHFLGRLRIATAWDLARNTHTPLPDSRMINCLWSAARTRAPLAVKRQRSAWCAW